MAKVNVSMYSVYKNKTYQNWNSSLYTISMGIGPKNPVSIRLHFLNTTQTKRSFLVVTSISAMNHKCSKLRAVILNTSAEKHF